MQGTIIFLIFALIIGQLLLYIRFDPRRRSNSRAFIYQTLGLYSNKTREPRTPTYSRTNLSLERGFLYRLVIQSTSSYLMFFVRTFRNLGINTSASLTVIGIGSPSSLVVTSRLTISALLARKSTSLEEVFRTLVCSFTDSKAGGGFNR